MVTGHNQRHMVYWLQKEKNGIFSFVCKALARRDTGFKMKGVILCMHALQLPLSALQLQNM